MPTMVSSESGRLLLIRVVGSDFDMRKRCWYRRDVIETGRRFVMESRRRDEPVPAEEIHAVFMRDGTMASFMKHYGLGSRKALKVLELYGIPFRAYISKEFQEGATLADLRERHSVGEATLSRWLRDAGTKVSSGRKIPDMPEDQVRQLWIATRSINHVANAYNVHWKTAQKRLQELGLS